MTPLEDLCATYLAHLGVERGLSGNTLSNYRRDLDRYRDYLEREGITAIAGITPALVGGFAAHLSEGDATHRPLAASSVARAVVAVRSFHRFIAREGLTPTDPAADVRPPSTGRHLPKALAVDQVEALLGAPDRDTPVGLRDAALLELLYGTGARISEVVRLDVDDVGRTLRAPADQPRAIRLLGKGSKERLVPLGSYAADALEAWLVRGRPGIAARSAGTPALFLNTRGARLSRQTAWEVVRRAAEAAGLDVEISPHTLRHSYATHLLDGGADVRVVQELLGHASVTTTQIYTLVTVDHLREVYAEAHPRAR
ncbi:integrase/recombinase XerD [Raineyella antarctica]|uniref:Tyrosine recombinase XerD n=1 Tax=Raineyella antarctica TaxID=1577474 RepID=A0A1G6GSQ9_9ACTN|nr:site-specific tyrosine recombinase XerD [Raineyella antarctica]SDB84735.1 integrase/recombinase XerD [Raineyella antarctica]